MNVDVGDHCQTGFSADFPKTPQFASVNNHDSGIQRSGVDIVVKYESGNPGGTPASTQEECTTLSAPIQRPTREFTHALKPNFTAANQLRLPTEKRSCGRC
jgi:hypothetical protein